MLEPSTRLLIVALVSLVAGVVLGGLLTIRGLRRRPLAARLEAICTPDERRVLRYLVDNAVRLASAQHWARGAMLSSEAEPWRPGLIAAAIAALVSRDDDELHLLLNSQAVGDPQVANVFGQAIAELRAERASMQWPFLSGLRADGSPDWNFPELSARAVKLLESAHAEATRRVASGLADSAQT